jgi:hypothetical protein
MKEDDDIEVVEKSIIANKMQESHHSSETSDIFEKKVIKSKTMHFNNVESSESMVHIAKADLPIINEENMELFEMETERKLVGIRNTKLTCYINAVIQLIFNCKK